MDDVRLGAAMRVIRTRRHLRQADIARRARVSRAAVSQVERGDIGRLPLDSTRAVANALGMRLDLRARWQGGELDRVVNAAHAAMHEELARYLDDRSGWTWRPEVTFSIYGERGVIDILAWHAASRCLLIVELKTLLVDPQELVSVTDRRRRLAYAIAKTQGWDPRSIGTWVVVKDTSTNQRRARAHSGLLRRAFPADGHAMRAWLHRPGETIDALSFWSKVSPASTRQASDSASSARKASHGRH
jgi:transcriptional regulator with XRE-family HTH domain